MLCTLLQRRSQHTHVDSVHAYAPGPTTRATPKILRQDRDTQPSYSSSMNRPVCHNQPNIPRMATPFSHVCSSCTKCTRLGSVSSVLLVVARSNAEGGGPPTLPRVRRSYAGRQRPGRLPVACHLAKGHPRYGRPMETSASLFRTSIKHQCMSFLRIEKSLKPHRKPIASKRL
jgi:hypothetical protein